MGLIQDKPKVALGAAFVLAAGLAVGAGIVFANAGDDTTSRATSPLVTPAPTQTTDVPTSAPSAEVTATPEATPTATATPTPTATTTASATPSATVSPGTTVYAYPKPSKKYDGLVLRGTLDPGNGTTDTTFHLTIKASDGDGKVRFFGLTYGDGTGEPAQADPTHCKSYPPLTSPPAAYQPEPSAQTYTFTHRYTRAGRYTLTMHLVSVNADCKPHGPAKETRDAAFTVTVIVPPPVPSPTPSPSPSA